MVDSKNVPSSIEPSLTSVGDTIDRDSQTPSEAILQRSDYQDVRGDGRIVLFRRNGVKWHVRLKIPNSNGYVTRSAKTSDSFEARRFAEDLYFELEGRVRRGEVIHSPLVRKVFEEWKRSFVSEKYSSPDYVSANLKSFERNILPFFGDTHMAALNDDLVSKFLEYRLRSSQPALSTLRNERTNLNNFFRFAVTKGYLRTAPRYRIPTGRFPSRPDIPREDWRKLVRFLGRWVREAERTNAAWHRDRFYLQQYILILGNCGIRVGEARVLRWRDVSFTATEDGSRRTIFTVRGKTGEREVACNESVTEYVERVRKRRLGEVRKIDPNEIIFCHKDGGQIRSYKKGFDAVMKAAGVQHSSDGKKRTIYSLRHTYATMRISEGVNIYNLAANMGTSVEMIEKFYGKKRVRDPRIAGDVTKVKRRVTGG